MKLLLDENYKSLTPFQIEISDFTIITGVNGAGKSHLLEGINEKKIQVTKNDVELSPIKFVEPFPPIPIPGEQSANRTGIKQNIVSYWNEYETAKHSGQLEIFRLSKRVKAIAEKAKKDVDHLTRDDFDRFFPSESFSDPIDIFYTHFAGVFVRYHALYIDNKFRKFLNLQEGNKDISYLTNEEFREIHGEPPWEFVNRIFREANLDYEVKYPTGWDADEFFVFKLINKLNGAEVGYKDLSSGEKIIMSKALALYNSNFDIEFPKLLLMDEPDASLHPSMTKQFLNVIENVFVKAKGMKVIITTHSPSTVALAPEKSLYVMNKKGRRIERTKKDKALKILTAGVPSFSVNYENRRQVFVESQYDVFFFEKLYLKLLEKLTNEISLNFISSGVGGKGNCEQVKEVVNKLVRYGNRFIFGIIDWDCKNNGNKHIHVLGKSKRYTKENYIFDPLLLSAFLLREKIVTANNFGLQDTVNYTNFKSLESHLFQKVSDSLTSKIESQVNPKDKTKDKVKYLNGIEIEIPRWYLRLPKDNLENSLREAFPKLKRIEKEKLKQEIINKVIDDIPELIPMDILDLFRAIQEQ